MEKYEKKIKYLDYLEYGNKIRNGGFMRTEKVEETCRIQISVKGLYPTDTLSADIILHCGARNQKVDTMMLHYGKGDYSAVWNIYNMAGSEMTYEEWSGVEIRVSEQRKIINVWENQTYENEDKVKNSEDKERVPEIVVAEKMVVVKEEIGQSAMPFADLYEDKWTQMQQYYKRIRPFGDKRSYLSITPRDFIVLGGKYQKLVSNSFLLHGYYNYGHVVLGRQQEGDGYQYYLGVPGIYHERERQVAKMFGFHGFEGAISPSSEGGFGYYMTTVEI